MQSQQEWEKKNDFNDDLNLNFKSVSFANISSPCRMRTSAKQIDKDVIEKLITLMSEELNKQINQHPRYDKEISSKVLQELKSSFSSAISLSSATLESLIIKTKAEKFESLIIKPEISTTISSNNLSAIGSFSGQKKPSLQSLKTDHTGAITCILA